MAGSLQQQLGAQILLRTSSFQFSENFENIKTTSGFRLLKIIKELVPGGWWFLGKELVEGWVVGLVWVL
jgi:hypothetical protein